MPDDSTMHSSFCFFTVPIKPLREPAVRQCAADERVAEPRTRPPSVFPKGVPLVQPPEPTGAVVAAAEGVAARRAALDTHRRAPAKSGPGQQGVTHLEAHPEVLCDAAPSVHNRRAGRALRNCRRHPLRN